MKRSVSALFLALLLLVEASQSFVAPTVVLQQKKAAASPFLLDNPSPVHMRLDSSSSLSMILEGRKEFLSSILSLALVPPSSDYKTRAANFGISSPREVKQLANQKNVVFLDVRNDAEISQQVLHTPKPIFYSQCSPDECPTLERLANESLTDEKAPVIVFCASGKRAQRGKATLDAIGYTNVINGGAIEDIRGSLLRK